MRRSDDDALSWDGDDDPTLDVGTAAPTEAGPVATGPVPADTGGAGTDAARATAVLPEGYTAVGRGSDAVGRSDEAGRAEESADVDDAPGTGRVEREPLGNATLITLGILGGVYALYVIGWIIGGLRLRDTAQFLIAAGAFQFGFWLAAAAPILWFVTTYLLTRGSKSWLRIVWLIAGALVLIPWPFVMTGTVGQ